MKTETFAATVGSGILSHIIFNRFEPRGIAPLLTLLLAPPFFVLSLSTESKVKLTVPYVWEYLSLLAIYLGTLTTSVILYRISPFHPLAAYPGPLINRITRLMQAYATSTGKQHIYYKELHDKYGPYVRTGPNLLHVDDVSILPDVMASKPFVRGERYEIAKMKNSKGSLITVIDPEEHAQRRKVWERGLNIAAVHEYADALGKRVHQLIDILEIRQGMEVDLSGWLSCLSFDFMGDLAFGGAFHLLDAGKDKNAAPIHRPLTSIKREVVGNIPWIDSFSEYLPGVNTSLEKVRAFAKQSVLARKEKGSSRKDLFYYLLDEAGLGSERLSLPTLTQEASLAIIAGSDTTGTALSNLFFFLLTHPDVYAKLQAEIDREFPKGADVFGSSAITVTRNMKYLNAVVNETLRLRPAVPSGIQRRLPKGTGGIMLGERFIPENTTVQMAAYSAHLNPKYFSPSPEKFYPERWVEEGPGHVLDYAAFFPFSYGPTNCAGKNLALFEMRAVVCSLIQKFEFGFAPGYDTLQWDKELVDYFIFVKGKLPVMIKVR